MKAKIEQLLRARTGPMTCELVLRPGDFGLGRVPSRLTPAGTARSICGFCSTGCSLKIHLNRKGEAINLTADPDYPVNLGMACPKGWEALTPLAASDRATSPLLRNPAAGRLGPVSWERALAAFVENFQGVQRRHGPHALAFLSTGQIVMEEMALLGALAKFGMGMLHVDSNTRQCMATSHVAYKQSFGFDAPPFTYADFEESDVLVFVGANPCIAHPIMWQRVIMNKRNPTIIVIDPRKTETAMLAAQHLALRPKGDLPLLYGLARQLIQLGAVKRDYLAAHTTGFAEFEQFVAGFTLERTAAESGVPVADLVRCAESIARGERVSFWWTMGVNQSHEATRTAQAIINLALMTGNIGRPGTGANSITGQCNAMGSRLFGNATSLLGGYDFASAPHRAHVAGILGIDTARIPAEKSWAYDEIIDGIERGDIRGLWVIATNTAHSWINSGRFAAIRAKLDFLVVQDMYATTETARMADLVLPAAGWGEKDGVFINSERRLGVTRKVARAPGAALSDFAIFQLVAEAWGCRDMFRAWSSPAAAFGLLKQLSRGQPCDFSGIRDYAQIEEAGGIQWPYPEAREPRPADRERRLFSDGGFFTPDGRARFHFDEPRPMPEPTDAEYPLILMTGRGSSAQWHTGSRTDKSAILRKLAPNALHVEINPADAAPRGIADGARVAVRSRRASIEAVAFVTAVVQPGTVFMPMHFPEVNKLTFPAYDPHSRQPSYKACAVAIKPLAS
ncbi:molybdopterin oxidoreductase family protein [Opitutus sp. GAS368]|uniref:molybdopterin oxidoreductase family protein n=1 Tax=Opitutus sp. GAS368 TaxID=1882749 RepID=UPI00087D720D|nr:molybdopterin oxidoreductase family protein [Opitutus sp. GAS368]SDR66128.1 nitrate reductase (quinol-dependent), catalytic subunit [Opitutus sp. GAS368]